MSLAPTALHLFVVGELHFALRTHLQNQSCYVFVAPFDVFFSESEQYDVPDHVTQPDLPVVCSKNRLTKNSCHGAPTMIIEVLSPRSSILAIVRSMSIRCWMVCIECVKYIYGAG
ncbi:Uma2 family endonuclease [Paenibacillus xylaniclasticus]|uniref:Uma2 family endonuclease n=1 Tax=Paenibacillus xylaniclasticus TaxID=588083 RepID=UPI0013DFFD57|nr:MULTISPECIES: Uma2 family endonuclease [Paenibacillus]